MLKSCDKGQLAIIDWLVIVINHDEWVLLMDDVVMTLDDNG